MPHTNIDSRAAQRIGVFGEGLVMYALIRKEFEVECVDGIGADLIADRDDRRIAVSVKTRLYRKGSKESRGFAITDDHLYKLGVFARRYRLEPVFAHVACDADERVIHLFMLRTEDLEHGEVKTTRLKDGGYYLNYSSGHLKEIKGRKRIDYSSWSDELIGATLFEHPPAPSI